MQKKRQAKIVHCDGCYKRYDLLNANEVNFDRLLCFFFCLFEFDYICVDLFDKSLQTKQTKMGCKI